MLFWHSFLLFNFDSLGYLIVSSAFHNLILRAWWDHVLTIYAWSVTEQFWIGISLFTWNIPPAAHFRYTWPGTLSCFVASDRFLWSYRVVNLGLSSLAWRLFFVFVVILSLLFVCRQCYLGVSATNTTYWASLYMRCLLKKRWRQENSLCYHSIVFIILFIHRFRELQ